MYPLGELKTLLSREEEQVGVVVATSTGAVTCATPTGLSAARVTGRSLRVGERVVVRAGIAYPRAKPGETYAL
jgi:hypothetical protein